MTYRIVEDLQLFIHPHLDLEPLLDEIHLMLTIFGGEIALFALLSLIAGLEVYVRLL